MVSRHVNMKRTGSRWTGLCPFHNEKTPSFSVSPQDGFFKCFGCGEGGDIFTFVQKIDNVDFMDAMQQLADEANLEFSFDKNITNKPDGVTRNSVFKANEWARHYFHTQLMDQKIGADARQYLADRNFSDDTIKNFSLGLAVGDFQFIKSAKAAGFTEKTLIEADLLRRNANGQVYDTFKDRIMFPISDTNRRVIGFGGRTLVNDKAKYINTRQNIVFDKGRNLYGIDIARDVMNEENRVILVEGYTDCIAAHQAGFSNTVATLGTAMTPQHVDLVRRFCDRATILFDSDRAGEEAANRAIEIAFPRYLQVFLARIPDGKDPGEFLSKHGPDDFSDVLNRAIDALEFKWNQIKDSYESEHSDATRSEKIHAFLRFVASIFDSGAVDAIQKGLLINRLSSLLSIDQNEVQRMFSKQKVSKPESANTKAVGNKSGNVHNNAEGVTPAWRRIIGVLLNEPGVLSEDISWPDFSLMKDERDRRIIQSIMDLYDTVGEFKPSEVADRCHEPGDDSYLGQLAWDGAKRGNYHDTLHVALQIIRKENEKQEYFSVSPENKLEQLHRRLYERKDSFVPQRKLR